MKKKLFIYKHSYHGLVNEGIIDFSTVTAVSACATYSDVEKTEYKITFTFKEGNHINIDVVSDDYKIYMGLIKDLMEEKKDWIEAPDI